MAQFPTGMKIRLEPKDEYSHTPDAASNYNESMYFNMFDPARKVGGAELVTRITEGMTEYRCQGKVGYGLSEYLDQIVNGRPSGQDHLER
jgi:hypothetical protein